MAEHPQPGPEDGPHSSPLLAGSGFDRAFPFHLELDEALRLTSIGSSLKRLCPELSLGDPWLRHFRIERPAFEPDELEQDPFAVLAPRGNTPFLIKHTPNEMSLRGQVQVDPERGRVLFLGLPWVTTVGDLQRTGIRIADFPVHTPLADLMFVIQNQQGSLTEARELAARLQRNQQVLTRAKREAEAAAVAKDAFLANISHEIRTPLNGIVGLTRLLSDTALDPDQVEYAELIARSSDSLLGVLEDILELARIRSDRLELNEAPFSLEGFLRKASELYRGAARTKGVELTLVLGPGLPRQVHGDAGRLRQIMSCLLGNAVKFTDRGKVVLEATADSIQDGVVALQIRVTDTGVGIPKDSLDRIFDEFVQADESSTRRHGGSGLGLSISRRLARMLSGTLEAESVEGSGATFRLQLPLRIVEPGPQPQSLDEVTGPVELLERGATPVPEEPRRAPESIQQSTVPLAPTGARLLVVEDNKVNQLVARRLLSKLGYVVDCAGDGIDALSCVRTQRYDLILMDLQMPRMDGFEATRRIRALDDEAAACVPIVALTANALPEHRARCLADGMDDFVAKPFDFEDLANTIAARLGAQSRQLG